MMRDGSPELRRLLDRLRGAVRRAYVLRGAGFLALAVSAILVGSYLLDAALDLPLAVRAVHLAIVATLAAVLAWRVLGRPLRTDVTDLDLAQAIEHGDPQMGDRLISALDFEARLGDDAEPESRELMRQVVDDARKRAAAVKVDRLIDPRPARRALGLGLAGVLALVATAAVAGDHFGLWVQRGLLLQDVDWPRRTTVNVLEFEPGQPLVVTRGDDVRIVAEVEGDLPRELQFHYEEFGDEFGEDASEIVYEDSRTMYPIEGEDRRFALDLRSVAASFRFWVTGGDDLDRKPVFEVKAVIPPRIASVSAEIDYPEYSGLASEIRDLTSLSVLEGSTVRYTLTANMPLSGARLVPLPSGDRPPPADFVARDLPVSGANGDQVELELTVGQTMRFHLQLAAEAGHTNRAEDDVFQLIATADTPPRVQVHYPDTRKLRTPEGIVPVKALVTDDFGAKTVTVEVRRNDEPAFVARMWPRDAEAPGAGTAEGDARKIDLYLPMDLLQFPVEGKKPILPGDTITLIVRAEDTTGKVKESPEISIEIISREAQEKRLSEEQSRLRAALVRLHGNASRNLESIGALLGRLRTRTPDAPAFDTARDAQVDQGRVTNELVQFNRGMTRVLDSLVLNRLSSAPTLERIQPIYETHLSRPAESPRTVFPDALYADILKEKRAGRLFDPEVVGTVLDILELGDRASGEVSPAVYDALRQWSADERHADEHLERAHEKAQELDRLLDRLEERMQRWEQLAEIIEILRALENTQRSLGEDVPIRDGTDSEDR